MSAADSAPARCEPEGHCITCGDDGVAMRVLSIDDERGLALCVDQAGSTSTVEIALVDPPPDAGDALLVHAGVALARLGDAG